MSSGAGSQLTNCSTLQPVGATANTFGFVISPGSGSRELLIRCDGPSLATFGRTGLLQNPDLVVLNAATQIVAQNIGWTTGNVTSLSLAFTEAGAFPFANPSTDSAIVANFAPGACSSH